MEVRRAARPYPETTGHVGYLSFRGRANILQAIPIYKYDFKAYRASTREKVWKMQKTFNEHWFKAADYHKASVDAAGNVVMGEAVSKFTPYSPLELE